MNPSYKPSEKVIPLKLFLNIAPRSSADITRALRGCFSEGSVYIYVVSFRYSSKQRDLFFDILITSKGASALGMS